MVIDAEQIAPYAPVQNVLSVIRRLRERGLPDRLNQVELPRLGIPEGNASRTLVALKFLGLIDEEGLRTPAFERLGKASTTEYPTLLAEVIRTAYVSVFKIVDPASATQTAIYDAFRHFNPVAQRERMVTLFIGLCKEAGIVAGGTPSRKPRERHTESERPKQHKIAETPKPHAQPRTDIHSDYSLLVTLVHQLPSDGKWTSTKRAKWLKTVEAAVDFHIEVVEEPSIGHDSGNG